MTDRSFTYKNAGVDIDAATSTSPRIRALARSTFTPGVLGEVGGFGALFSASFPGMTEPVLVSSTDGVGTKLKIAFLTGRHNTVGGDLVNHCIDDILVQGARPLFFMDYIATGRLDPEVVVSLVEGISRACGEGGCALTGGETAEMPGFYADGEYDVAGFIVGIVDREKIIDGSAIRPGDILVGLPSVGLHTNGYSLARKLFFEVAGWDVEQVVPILDASLGDTLLQPHVNYEPTLRKAIGDDLIGGLAHITGGGITDNLVRVLPAGCGAEVDLDSWPVLPVFQLMEKIGRVQRDEMLRATNMGIGMIAVVRPDKMEHFAAAIDTAHYVIGRIVQGESKVSYRS